MLHDITCIRHVYIQVGDQIEAYSLLSGETFTGHVTVIDSEEVSGWVKLMRR